MLKISKMYFSPSNTTKGIVEAIASKFEGKPLIYDLLSLPDSFEGKEFSEKDLLIIGLPIFIGRIPDIAKKRLEKFKGNGTPTIAFVNYGNREYEDGLLELKDTLEENGFKLVGVGAFISQHSIFTDVAKGRPDEKDLEKINEFTLKCIKKIESKDFSEFTVPGNKPYREYQTFPLAPACDESKCIFCYECILICPENAIPEADPVGTKDEECTGCTACIKICPQSARSFEGDIFKQKNEEFTKANINRKEGEFFL